MEYSKEAFLKLYEPVHESFARFCQAKAYGIMEPEDLISESVLKALENFSSIRNPQAFLSFMFTIAKNIVIKKLRREKFSGNYNEQKFNRIPDESLNPETRMDIQMLYEALNQLPENQKEALILFEISGFSLKEVADIQHAGLSAVKQRIKRGREALGKILRSDELTEEPVSGRSKILLSVFL